METCPSASYVIPFRKNILALAICSALSGAVGYSDAATFTVTTLDSAGPGSLAQAITDANENEGADEILFEVTGTIEPTEELIINDDVTVSGPDDGELTISNALVEESSLLYVSKGEFYWETGFYIIDVTIRNLNFNSVKNSPLILASSVGLTVENSHFVGGLESGSAIYQKEYGSVLTIDNSSFVGFKADTVFAGSSVDIRRSLFEDCHDAVFVGRAFNREASSARIIDSVFRGNQSKDNGGAVYLSGYIVEATIENSLFENNAVANVSDNTWVGNGGAIYSNSSGNNEVSVENSVFIGNKAEGSGGAIWFASRYQGNLLHINNSLFSGNSAVNGGAVYLAHHGTEILGSTIVNNTSTEAGGGIYSGTSGEIILVNSVVAENESLGVSADLFGIYSVDYSLLGIVDEGSDTTITEITPGYSQSGSVSAPIDPLIGALQNNGSVAIGPNGSEYLPTISPLEFSPLLGAGDATAEASVQELPLYDIRGEGFDRIQEGALDIGAVELFIPDITPDNFEFDAIVDAAFAQSVDSKAITISGVNSSTPLTIENGEYSVNDGEYTSDPADVVDGDVIKLRHITSTEGLQLTETVLTVGGVEALFQSTTMDAAPDVFTFASVANVGVSELKESEAITVMGITAPVAITVADGEYSINEGSYTSGAGTVAVGDAVKVRHTSSATTSTTTETVLSIGTVQAVFSTTTIAPPGSSSTASREPASSSVNSSSSSTGLSGSSSSRGSSGGGGGATFWLLAILGAFGLRRRL